VSSGIKEAALRDQPGAGEQFPQDMHGEGIKAIWRCRAGGHILVQEEDGAAVNAKAEVARLGSFGGVESYHSGGVKVIAAVMAGGTRAEVSVEVGLVGISHGWRLSCFC
jgi:hypothetical protein